ncbi:helix-turn-helix domain-containing protein [Aidingimonas lacisalsi]|uniref:helix-turn-helix domain-containing protein n=1 Tax=Aidingimonas lacisalsi TaxID=2604086 RepID=UPI0011D19918|nr:helix-turn-helix transcriptional regulator [Aidingimonas lacisalsi]
MEELGARIKRLREHAKLNKAALARQVGVSDVTIGYWESGEIKQIGHTRLVALAEALGCGLDELLTESPETPFPFLQLTPTLPLPWQKHASQVTALPISWPNTREAPIPCYIVTPSPEATFDHLPRGDLAAITPTESHQGNGLYIVEYQGRLSIQRMENDNLHLPSRSTPHIHGRLIARWSLVSD